MTSDRVKEGEDLQSSSNTVIPKKSTTLNPNAKVFQSPKLSSNSVTTTPDSTDSSNPDWSGQSDHESRNSAASSPQVAMTTQGGTFQMNGDVGNKYPSQSGGGSGGGGGSVGYPPTPESPQFPLHNGYIPGTEFPYLPDGQIVTAEDLSQQEPPKGDDLRKLLQRQLEYYFSRENLANDRYLQSQMDGDQYVPIGTISNFNAVKKLTKDMQLIVEVLRESPFVQVDMKGEKVRPNHKRCTVILREVPDATPIEDVKALFTGEKCPKFVSCEFAHNSNWYITFESDVDAQMAYRFLREEVGTFQGKPIMARIKAKPLQRISFSPKLVNANGYTTVAGNQPMYQQQQFQFPPSQQPINGMNGISVPTSMAAAPQPQPPQPPPPQPAQQPQYAYYPNVAVAPQQWPTSPTAFFEPTMQQQQPFTTGAFPSQSKFQPINTARQASYPGHAPPRQSRPPKPRTASTPELRAVDRSSMQENSMQRHPSQNDRRTAPQMNGHLHPSPRFNNYETLATTVERREERTEPPPPPPPPVRDNKVEMQSGYRGRRAPPIGRYDETARQESTLQTAPRDRRAPRSSTYSSRRRREEDMPSSRRNSRDSRDVRDSREAREKEVPKPPSPPIDLASFPPLPGRPVELMNGEEEKETNNNEMFMPMADIVKGVKDPKRIKAQEAAAAAAKASSAASIVTSTASKQPPSSSPATKDSSTNTSDKEQTSNSSSKPLPPSTSTTNSSSKHTQIQVATQTDLDDSSSKSEATKPQQTPKGTKPNHTMCNTAVNTSVSMATSSGVTASIATTTTSVSTSTTAVSTSETATTTHNSASTNSSAKTPEPPRLSYAAMLSRKAAAPKPNPQPEPTATTTQSNKSQSSSASQPTQATTTTSSGSKPPRQSSRFSHRGDRDRDSYGETNTRSYPFRREHYGGGGRRSPPHQKPSSK